MTGAQLAYLRSVAAEAARWAEAAQGTAESKVDRHGAFIDHDQLTRLLEERKRLLAAAKLGEYYAAVAAGAGKAEPSEIYAIAEAITFAEEAAP